MTGGTLVRVRKSSIYIDDEVDLALTRRAATEGRTKAELIREALREAARSALQVKPRAVGVFAGPPDLAADVDAQLTQTGFGER